MLFGGRNAGKTVKIRTYESICKQIKAIEYQIQKAIANNKPQRNIFALNGKLKNLIKERDELVWLGK